MSTAWADLESEFQVGEIGPGVAEVYAGTLLVGVITWNPNRRATRFYVTHAHGGSAVPCTNRQEALELLAAQHEVTRHLVRTVRAIRPASEGSRITTQQYAWDQGYNAALRDVERVLAAATGPAPAGEGYTAITH